MGRLSCVPASGSRHLADRADTLFSSNVPRRRRATSEPQESLCRHLSVSSLLSVHGCTGGRWEHRRHRDCDCRRGPRRDLLDVGERLLRRGHRLFRKHGRAALQAQAPRRNVHGRPVGLHAMGLRRTDRRSCLCAPACRLRRSHLQFGALQYACHFARKHDGIAAMACGRHSCRLRSLGRLCGGRAPGGIFRARRAADACRLSSACRSFARRAL